MWGGHSTDADATFVQIKKVTFPIVLMFTIDSGSDLICDKVLICGEATG